MLNCDERSGLCVALALNDDPSVIVSGARLRIEAVTLPDGNLRGAAFTLQTEMFRGPS
jgi:hypothetical protein